MKNIILTAASFIAFPVLGGTNLQIDRAWERISDPLIMNIQNYNLSSLPTSGSVTDKQKAWSSDYWARKKGGINYRWNAANPTGFNYSSPTKAQAMSMSLNQLKQLAPSEKYDLLMGRYDYPLKREIAAYASPNRPVWEGICDGWSAAAMVHDEPTPKTKANPDGIQIPFGSSDIKGLLSWYYARKFAGGYAFMGRRCYGKNVSVDRCNQDMNAGAFHLVLTNRLGLKGLPFIADIDRGAEVWNHIASKFKSTVQATNLPPLSTSAVGTVSMVKMKTVVTYVYILRSNSWDTVIGTSKQRTITRTYSYYLDLDSQGDIIGGEWLSTTRPDFLWLERKSTNFSGYFSRLPELLNDTGVAEELKLEELAAE